MQAVSLDKTFDQCLANMVVKSALGLGIGLAGSVFFKRKQLLIGLTTGIGSGMAYQQCQTNFDVINRQLFE